jgi:quinohemoprotein ethanol dehydrogenase
MRCRPQAMALVWISIGLLISLVAPVRGADQEINELLRSPVARNWVTNGGNLTNQRYSTFKQIDTTNVKQLNGAWMTRLKRSGFGTRYSAEATPLVKDGIMYMVTGNDDVFALNAKTGEILWQRWSWIDQKISVVCCGWLSRGLAMGEGLLFVGQLDANVLRSTSRPAKRFGGGRSRTGTMAIASPVRHSTTTASSIAASPAANWASGGD